MTFRSRSALTLALLAFSFGACRKPQIRVYLAPKAAPPAVAAHPAHSAAEAPATEEKPRPQLGYTLPDGWTKAAPNSVSLLAFAIKSGSAEANVSVTPLPNLAGREGLVVNMWREQAGLPPIENEDLAKTLEPVEIGGEMGRMFEVLGAREGGAPLRIVTAFTHRPEASWFYKLSGEEALVTAQKPAFVEFLKGVRLEETAPQTPETP